MVLSKAVTTCIFIYMLQRTASETLTKQPYGVLMCEELAHAIANQTYNIISFETLHLSCQIKVRDVPVSIPQILDWEMKNVFCTVVPGFLYKQQICQILNDQKVCSFLVKDRACVLTKKRDSSDTFVGTEVSSWIESNQTGLFCAPRLQYNISRERLIPGKWVTLLRCNQHFAPPKNNTLRWESIECGNMIIDLSSNIFISRRESINCLEKLYSRTLLTKAIVSKQFEIFKILLALGADFSYVDKSRFTLLHHACKTGFLDIVKILVQLGLDIEARTNSGHTPFLLAKNVDTMKYLVGSGCDINAVTYDKKNILHLAAELLESKIIDYLLKLKYNFSLMAKDDDGLTPHEYALGKDAFELAEKLDPNIQDVP